MVYFENTECVNCGSILGFDDRSVEMLALDQEGRVMRQDTLGEKFKFCANKAYWVCNWLLPEHAEEEYCLACMPNKVIPNLNKVEYRLRWSKIEEAKHRLAYSALKLRLPFASKRTDPEGGLSFEFKSDSEEPTGSRVLTGHANGVITLNIEEADDVEREMARKQMEEVYRTLLGHFRHEIAHYYWEVLIRDRQDRLARCREVFGDERIDYGESLEKHYAKPDDQEWRNEYISRYAAAHAWEDWAETWAHYMHIVDTLETAHAFGVSIKTKSSDDLMDANLRFNAYNAKNFDRIYDNWLPVVSLMNSMNKSMGMNDIYPFVINPKVYEKLRFIHDIIWEHRIEWKNLQS